MNATDPLADPAPQFTGTSVLTHPECHCLLLFWGWIHLRRLSEPQGFHLGAENSTLPTLTLHSFRLHCTS